MRACAKPSMGLSLRAATPEAQRGGYERGAHWRGLLGSGQKTVARWSIGAWGGGSSLARSFICMRRRGT
jgi:hypothetical protein